MRAPTRLWIYRNSIGVLPRVILSVAMKGSTNILRNPFVDPNACGLARPMVGFDSENHLVVLASLRACSG